jgi:hypothetical protein
MIDKLTKYVLLIPTIKKLTAQDRAMLLFIIHIFQTKGFRPKDFLT